MNPNRTDKFLVLAHLKDAHARTLRSTSVPMKALAQEVDKNLSYLYALADAHDIDNFASLPLTVRLLPYCTDPALVDFLAALQGRITVQAPTALGPADLDQLAELVDAFGSLVRWHAKAIADGTFSADDARQYETHANRVVRAVLAQIAYVHTQAAGPATTRKAVSA